MPVEDSRAPRARVGAPAAPAARRPVPIPISPRARNLIVLALVGLLALILWSVPVLVVVVLGGFAMAMVLSFPVELFARVMPRPLAILIAFLILLAVLLFAAYVFLPLILSQFGALLGAIPGLIDNLETLLIDVLTALDRNDLLFGDPADIAAGLGDDLTSTVGVITENVLGRTVGIVFGTFNVALTLFAVVFVAVALLANVRGYKASFVTSVPARYRFDARELWDTLADALTRYLGGLALVLAVQGAASAVALTLIGVPYPLALGAWVSITAVVPFIGPWVGAVPAVLVAFSVSPTAVLLTALAFLAIQQLEGNVLTPRIQGQTIRVPSVIVFLAVIAGGALFGIMGILFAVPTLAVLRVLFDFFRVRLRVVRPNRP